MFILLPEKIEACHKTLIKNRKETISVTEQAKTLLPYKQKTRTRNEAGFCV
jgi:hypothetical protein